MILDQIGLDGLISKLEQMNQISDLKIPENNNRNDSRFSERIK